MSDERHLDWAHGSLTVQRLGAMLAPLRFRLPGGRVVEPLHVAPWAGEPGTEELPGVLRRLRGEWPCVPFGYGRPQPLSGDWAGAAPETGAAPHGEGSNREWDWLAADGALRLGLDLPPGNPIARLEREIRPDTHAPAVDLSLTILPRADCRLPIGLHPVFRVPPGGAGLRIVADARAAFCFPGSVEPGISRLAPGGVASDLSALPLAAGGTLDARTVPLPFATEELVQLAGVPGVVRLHWPDEQYSADLCWDAAMFPGVVLWFSNMGRKTPPWNGQHLALGVEPVAAAFDLGTSISATDNPLSRRGVVTAQDFRAGQAVTTRYRLSVCPD